MDRRQQLKTGYTLHVQNAERGGITYTVCGETGRGASCIVYQAFYRNNAGTEKAVRIKECCPYSLQPLRLPDGFLQVSDEKETSFEQEKRNMREAFRLNDLFFDTNGLTNAVTNTVDLYEANNTVYIVTAYEEGTVLSFDEACSLEDHLLLVRSAAQILQKMHAAGFLYLDLKPDNILVTDQEKHQVRLFDFDSLYPLSSGIKVHGDTDGTARVAFTRGFSAHELQSGITSQIGPWTDVYSIGALLFYLLFRRMPEAPDCDEDAEYDYRQASFSPDEYPDRLLPALTEIFHRTLAGYYKDRCRDMGSVIHLLNLAVSHADRSRPFLHSVYTAPPVYFTGREKELNALESWWEKNSAASACFVVNGMGGIGKSTLVRQFIARYRTDIASVLYLSVGTDICRQITDDGLVRVNTIRRNAAETEKEYFSRKMDTIRTILQTQNNGAKTLLVLDNFEPESFAELKKLFSAGWKILILTRYSVGAELYENLSLKALDSAAEQRQLFEHSLGRRIHAEEESALLSVLKLVCGHTLAIELIAKQISAGSISLADAEQLVRREGFSKVDSAKIDYIKDLTWQKKQVNQIIRQLFKIRNLPLIQRRILSILVLYGEYGVPCDELAMVMNVDCSDLSHDAACLCKEGLLQIREQTELSGSTGTTGLSGLSVHPVIAEVIRESKWDRNCLEDADSLMDFYIRKLSNISSAGTCQAHMDPDNRSVLPTEHQRLSVLATAELILAKSELISALKRSGSRQKLLCSTVLHMPPEREDFILRQGAKLIGLSHNEDSDEQKATTNDKTGKSVKTNKTDQTNKINKTDSLPDPGRREQMLVLERMTGVLLERADFRKASKLLRYAARKAGPGPYCRGIYSFMMCDYYDYLLDGEYDTSYDRSELKECIRSLRQGIRYFRLAGNEASVRCFRCMLSLDNILIRSDPVKQKMIVKVLRESERLLRTILDSDNAQPKLKLPPEESCIDPYGSMNPGIRAELLVHLLMTKGWYYTYVQEDAEKVKQLVLKAVSLASRAFCSEIESIDMVLVPAANMLFELGEPKPSIEYLNTAVQICDSYPDIIPFQRKKKEMLDHIRQVRKGF